MLTELRIRNFQSLEQITLRLGKLTVIAGPSNTGKSALVRAIRVLLSNPRGDHYRRGTGEVEVGLEVSDGDRLWYAAFVRAKQSTYLLEVLDSEGEDAVEYSAIGSSVPEAVSRLLNIDVGRQVSDQFDSPYLLAETPSQRAKALGALTNADLLMQAVGRAGSSAKENETQARGFDGVAARDADRLEVEFGWYPEVAREAVAANRIRTELAKLLERRSALRGVVSEVEATSARCEALRSLLSAVEGPRAEAFALLVEAGQQEQHGRALRDLVAELNRAEFSVITLTRELEAARTSLTGAHAELHAYLESEGVCPTCEQKLTKKAKEHLANV